MADVAEPVWQDNYTDLGDDVTIRFGGECLICQARFATNAIPILAPSPELAGAGSASIEDQKFAAFSAFDAAFRSILIPCFRCGNLACPECWDVDKQMCGACVAERGLVRSPHRGGPVEGPLADGFLRRTDPGRYSEAGRPAWLKELLRAQADPPAARSMSSPSLSIAGLASQSATAQYHSALDPNDSAHLAAPVLPFNPQQFDAPTFKLPAPPATALPQPIYQDRLSGTEGEATASLIACPQCGARNYDFVTRCVECGLQLIQVCPNCEQLNSGHATACASCGSPLDRPTGWTAVRSPVLQLQRARTDQSAPPVALKDQPNKRPINNSSAIAPRPAPPRASYATPAVSAPPMPTLDPQGVAAFAPVGEHPYETAVSGTRPAKPARKAGARAAKRPRKNTRRNAAPTPVYRPSVFAGVGLAFERTLTILVILAMIAIIAVAVAAEQSPAANHWLSLTLHVDVKSHLDKMLYWLHNQLHLQPQS